MVKFRVFMLILVSAFISDGVYAASSGDSRDDGEWDQTVHELEGLEDTMKISSKSAGQPSDWLLMLVSGIILSR